MSLSKTTLGWLRTATLGAALLIGAATLAGPAAADELSSSSQCFDGPSAAGRQIDEQASSSSLTVLDEQGSVISLTSLNEASSIQSFKGLDESAAVTGFTQLDESASACSN